MVVLDPAWTLMPPCPTPMLASTVFAVNGPECTSVYYWVFSHLCCLIPLNQAGFSPLDGSFVRMWTLKLHLGADQLDSLKTLWRSWSWSCSKFTPEQFIYGVKVIQPQSKPATRCTLHIWAIWLAEARCALHSGMQKSSIDVQSMQTAATSCKMNLGLTSQEHSACFLYLLYLHLPQTHVANKG